MTDVMVLPSEKGLKPFSFQIDADNNVAKDIEC